MLSDATCPFAALFAEPTRNGLMRPKAVRGSGVKMVNMGEIFAHPRLKNVAMERVPVDQSDRSRFLLQDGDLLFARQSLVLTGAGKCSIFLGDNEPATFESHIIRVRLNQAKANPLYYYYYFQSHEGRAAIQSIVEQGAGASGIRATDLAAIDVAWCPITVQDAIAHILGTLDDKIELNRRMNETLEEMTRALFKSWFVDFDPVRAKMEGRDTGLPPDVAALFPDRLVESELGEIPEGWEVKTLNYLAALNPESWSRTNHPKGVEYVDLANTKWGVIEATQYYFWKDAPSRAKRVLRSGDTIVGTVRPGNGSYSLVGHEGLTGSTGFAVLRPIHPRYRELVYLSATSAENIKHLAHRADGAAYPAVRPDVVSETRVVTPSIDTDILNIFSMTVAPIVNRMESNKAESRILATIRDILLPKLVSGEIRVIETEYSIENLPEKHK